MALLPFIAVTGGVNPRIDGGIFEAEDRPTVEPTGLPDDIWIRSGRSSGVSLT
jgi:hypothetical protein